MSISFSNYRGKWLVTRTKRGLCHSLHDPEHWSTSHYFSHWQIVLIACQMKNCVVVLFLGTNKRNSLAKILKNFLF